MDPESAIATEPKVNLRQLTPVETKPSLMAKTEVKQEQENMKPESAMMVSSSSTTGTLWSLTTPSSLVELVWNIGSGYGLLPEHVKAPNHNLNQCWLIISEVLLYPTREVFINSLPAKFFRVNVTMYMYFHFMSFLHIDMTQVLKILPHVRPGSTYSTESLSWLLMSWRHKEPGHQKPWYWPS